MGKLREKASATNVQSVIKEISDFTDTNLGAKLFKYYSVCFEQIC